MLAEVTASYAQGVSLHLISHVLREPAIPMRDDIIRPQYHPPIGRNAL